MNVIISVLIEIGCMITLLLIIALFVKKEYNVNREIVINAPQQNVFDFLKLLKNHDKFNNWANLSPGRKWEYKGKDGIVGFIAAWSDSKNIGAGEKEIIKIIEGKSIETQITAIKPIKFVATIIMDTESLSPNQTKVHMINSSTLKYPMNLINAISAKNAIKEIDSSLLNLKKLLENEK